MTQRAVLAAAVIVVLLALALGIRAVGDPREARLHRLDASRVEVLERISTATDLYSRRHDRLPLDLAALREFSNVSLHDPETGEPFEYRRTSDHKYELCATFARPTPQEAGTTFWRHPAGRHCYQLAVREAQR